MEAKRGHVAPGAVVTDGCEPPCVNSGPLEEQEGPLSHVSSSSPATFDSVQNYTWLKQIVFYFCCPCLGLKI